MFQVAEVVETKMAFKSNQKDDSGNVLPLGSIQIRLGGSTSILGQVRNVFARPLYFNRRIPLIGEQILVCAVPLHDHSSSSYKSSHFGYVSSPYNATDDLTLHKFPKIWGRSGDSGGGSRLSDKETPGYCFPKNPPKVENLQPFEGDDLWEGRFGQSIRFGSHMKREADAGLGIYEKKPTWKGTKSSDPLIIFRVKKPSGGGSKYTIEDLSKDEASIYITTTHKLPKLKVAYSKNSDARSIPNWKKGSQVVIDADRVVINSKTDTSMILGKNEVLIHAPSVLLQDKKYKVYLSDLMTYIDDMNKQIWLLASGQKQFATPAGPTATATSMADITKLHKAEFPKLFLKP